MDKKSNKFFADDSNNESKLLWHQVFVTRFRNMGFKYDRVNWRQAYVYQINKI